MAQREDLELERRPCSGAGAEGREESEEDRLHEGSELPHLSSAQREPPVPAHGPRNSGDVGRVGVFGTDTRVERRTMTEKHRDRYPLRGGGGNP